MISAHVWIARLVAEMTQSATTVSVVTASGEEVSGDDGIAPVKFRVRVLDYPREGGFTVFDLEPREVAKALGDDEKATQWFKACLERALNEV